MREIKFNLWDIERQQYYRDVLSLENDKIKKWGTLDIRTSDNVVWLQFTGLTDKNGVGIYEGDVLKTRYGTTFYYNDLVDYHLWDINNSIAFSEVEIIGNIYQNPELLK